MSCRGQGIRSGEGSAAALAVVRTNESFHPSPQGVGPCDVCGSADVREVRCKVICWNCRTILQSCADL